MAAGSRRAQSQRLLLQMFTRHFTNTTIIYLASFKQDSIGEGRQGTNFMQTTTTTVAFIWKSGACVGGRRIEEAHFHPWNVHFGNGEIREEGWSPEERMG